MRVLRTCVLGGAAALAGAAAVKPDPTTTYGAWEGWGVSLAWFANVFGGRKDLAQAMYGLGNVSVALGGGGSQVVPGLGFTIGRYNVGGSGPGMTQSPNMPNWKAIAGYWQSDSVWDWTVDANQRAFALQAQAAGATTFELFSNSPMWWMLNNNNPSGSNDGSSDNLASNRYQQHAHYMATVAAYFAANFNITFATVEAFNEPIATWWKASGTQEGCHFDVSTQANVLLRLRGELDAAGLKTTLIASSDESLTDQALATWQGLNASARAVIGQVNVHGYEGASGNRAELYKEVVVQGGKVNEGAARRDAARRRQRGGSARDAPSLRPAPSVDTLPLPFPGSALSAGPPHERARRRRRQRRHHGDQHRPGLRPAAHAQLGVLAGAHSGDRRSCAAARVTVP